MAKSKAQKQYRKDMTRGVVAGVCAGYCTYEMVKAFKSAGENRQIVKSEKAAARIEKKTGRR